MQLPSPQTNWGRGAPEGGQSIQDSSGDSRSLLRKLFRRSQAREQFYRDVWGPRRRELLAESRDVSRHFRKQERHIEDYFRGQQTKAFDRVRRELNISGYDIQENPKRAKDRMIRQLRKQARRAQRQLSSQRRRAQRQLWKDFQARWQQPTGSQRSRLPGLFGL